MRGGYGPTQPGLPGYAPPMNPSAYPQQVAFAGVGGADATDEALLRKLNELDGYLQNNPSRYYQANSQGLPMFQGGMAPMYPAVQVISP